MKFTGERLLTDGLSKIAIEHIHRYAFALQYVKNKKVVDIASGEGYGSNLLASVAKNVIGIDISQETVEHAKRKYKKDNLVFMQGAADKIPIDANSIDIVISFETIEHHDKHQEMLNEIKRILKHNGMLIISSPDKLNYSDIPQLVNGFHVKELYFEEFKSIIEKNFSQSIFLNQKLTYSSLIIHHESNSFYEFFGDFIDIKKHIGLEKPIYNIAIASQNKIENVFSSSFNGDAVITQILQQFDNNMNEILNSKTYKLGKFIAMPYIIIKKLFNA